MQSSQFASASIAFFPAQQAAMEALSDYINLICACMQEA